MSGKVSAGTIARTICLALALANQALAAFGRAPIPVGDEDLTQLVSLLFTVGASVAAWWKNNSFTPEAIEADETLKALRETRG